MRTSLRPPAPAASRSLARPAPGRRAAVATTATALALALCAAALPRLAQAQVSFDEGVLRAYLSQHLAATAVRESLTRFEVQSIGPVESAATLAPCVRAEPFIPPSARPWGRTSIGVRCVQGAAWSVMVPAQVAAWGRAVVTATALPAGTVLGEQDLQEQEIELTREPAGIARDAAALVGKATARALPAGAAIRADMARAPLAVQAGDPVRLRIQGSGFAITASGQALAAASAGQSVKVRSELGKILNGVAREGRIVDVNL